MSNRNHVKLYLLVLLVLAASGCSLVTTPPTPGTVPLGDELIINELFTIAPDKFYAYSWIELYNPSDRTIRWFDAFFPASLVTVGGSGTMLRTDDDGDAWNAVQGTPAVNFNDVDFPYPDTGVIVGENGFINRIIRSGGNYQFVPTNTPVPTTNTLRALTGISASLGSRVPTMFTAGDRGTILRTINLGKDWAVQTTNTTKTIRAIKMGTVSRTYACGDSGLILSSIDRPGVWNPPTQFDPEYALTNFNTVGVSGSTADTAWVGGSGGVILSSKNRGSTWFPDTSNTTSTLLGSWFLGGSMRAWMVGENGTIVFKEYSGMAWHPQTSGTTATLRSVTFVDSLRGWIVGDGGLILTTTNAGRRWNVASSGSSTTLLDIYPLPLSIRVSTAYIIEMLAIRKEFLFDITTRTFNFDYIVRQDTGIVYFSPEFVPAIGQIVGRRMDIPDDIPAFGFALINNDSLRLVEHGSLGPGKPEQIDYSIGFYPDTNELLGIKPVLWSLLESGEIRLQKIYQRILNQNQFLDFTIETIDVVRWGGFRPNPDPFPQNEPAGMIPEWWSLARYADDVGGDASSASTNASFYMTKSPIPGWYSQEKKAD
jgi:photosystem II stability/assembly factor-like uncharacterized protein